MYVRTERIVRDDIDKVIILPLGARRENSRVSNDVIYGDSL